MKIFVSFIIAGLLSLSSAYISPENAKADVVSYVEPKIFNLLSKPGVARAGGGVKCYDKYIPLITAATENSKTDTEACIARAISRREDELNKVKTERESLDAQVNSVEETLSACLKKEDDLEYLKCLKENSEILQSALIEVGKTSSTLSDKMSVSYKNIDTAEDSCIKAVISKSKSVSDELLAALQNCLMNGLDDGSDAGSEGGSDSGSESGGSNGSDGGSDGAANGDSDGGSDNGSDAGSDSNNGSDSGSDGGADNNQEGDADGGADNNPEGGSEGETDNNPEGDSNGGADNNPEGNSNGEADNGFETGSDGAADSDSDSGVVPNPDILPEEDLTP